jgi:hypothetical protein
LTKWARFGGEDVPRCMQVPSQADIDDDKRFRRGKWECTLPKGHEKYDDRRHQPHSWVQSGEDN